MGGRFGKYGNAKRKEQVCLGTSSLRAERSNLLYFKYTNLRYETLEGLRSSTNLESLVL